MFDSGNLVTPVIKDKINEMLTKAKKYNTTLVDFTEQRSVAQVDTGISTYRVILNRLDGKIDCTCFKNKDSGILCKPAMAAIQALHVWPGVNPNIKRLWNVLDLIWISPVFHAETWQSLYVDSPGYIGLNLVGPLEDRGLLPWKYRPIPRGRPTLAGQRARGEIIKNDGYSVQEQTIVLLRATFK